MSGRGTLFRYFATKDELLNELYLAIKLRLVRTMIAGLDRTRSARRERAQYLEQLYRLGRAQPDGHKRSAGWRSAERITDETRHRKKESFFYDQAK